MLLIAFTASVNALPLDEVSSSAAAASSSAAAASSSSAAAAASSAAEGGGIEFPNTAFIPGDLTEQLNVDDFFSLWLFFLDDDVTTSGNINLLIIQSFLYLTLQQLIDL